MEKMNRRRFIGSATLATVGAGAVGTGSILTSCGGDAAKQEAAVTYTPYAKIANGYIPELPSEKAPEGKPLKCGVIGCGGRGSGAAMDFLNAADNVTITALGDVFADRLNGLKDGLKKRGIEVADDKCFVGFDAYQKVIDTDVDVVILATPPGYRPMHFKYAIEKGKHAFMEKPIMVDAAGYRTLIAASKQADAKKLSVVCGTQRHHQRSYVDSFKKIQEGLIGEVTGGNVYWNQGMLWYRDRDKSWTDMEWMIRDWVNWTWLSGDHIVEQHVHNIDVFNWMSGLKCKSAVAFGSRQRRVTGNQYDNFSVDFEYENGVHMHSMCRQINGCATNVSEFVQGTKGSWWSGDMTIRDLQGNVVWKYDGEAEKQNFKQNNPYVLEHVNLIQHIRKGVPLNQTEDCANSSMCAVMGRESAYTGQKIDWDKMVAADQNLMPEKQELGTMDMATLSKIPVPGN